MQFLCVPTTYVTEIKETYFEIYAKTSIMSIVFASFKLPKLPISIKVPVALQQIAYICMAAISMDYLFANLVVVHCAVPRFSTICCSVQFGSHLNCSRYDFLFPFIVHLVAHISKLFTG